MSNTDQSGGYIYQKNPTATTQRVEILSHIQQESNLLEQRQELLEALKREHYKAVGGYIESDDCPVCQLIRRVEG